MAKTTAQKIAESQAGRKSRDLKAKQAGDIARRAERKITPERRRQIEAANRETNREAQKIEESASLRSPEELKRAETLRAQQSDFNKQLDSGFSARTTVSKEGAVSRGAKKEPLSFADQLRGEVGAISAENGPSPEQQKAIAAIEDFNKNFNTQQEETKKKTDTQLKRGLFTGGAPAKDLFGGLESPGGELPADSPDVFKEQVDMAGGVAGAEVDNAFANQEAAESLRENKLRGQLSKLSLGDEGGNVLQAIEGNLGQLSLPQLEQLAATNGLELTDALKASLSRDGKSAIEREKITKEERLAENEYSKRQLSRTYDRAITDREEFNLQQDARLRRLAGSFGGGKASTLGSNVAVMKEAEKGQRVLEDLTADYSDKTMLVSQRADTVIKTYGNNIQVIEGQMADAIENKYAEITNTIDDLLDAGITNEVELNNAVLKAKKDYAKSYSDISTKAFEAIQDQNQQFFDNQITLRDQKLKEDKERSTSIFDNQFGDGFSSTQTSDTTNMSPTETASKNGSNCVLFAREQVPNLPTGLWTKADKQRAIDKFGFRSPDDVKIGDAILTAEGQVGHAAVVVGIEGNNLILEEANYVSGQVTKGRRIDAFDSNIYGFIAADGGGSQNNGGNIALEGANVAIQTQTVNEAGGVGGVEEFTPSNTLEQEASQFLKSGGDILDLQRRGFSESDINQVVLAARQIEEQFPSPLNKLTDLQRTETFALVSNKFGKRALKNPDVINSVAQLKAQGLTNDEIEDRLRFSGFGATFTGSTKSAFDQITQKGFSSEAVDRAQERLEDLQAEFGADSPQVKNRLLSLAIDKGSTIEQGRIGGRIEAMENLINVRLLLDEFVSKKGSTGLLKGSLEKFQNNVLKITGDADLANIANQIQLGIIDYRKAVSGAAFTEAEEAQYEQVFPNIKNTPELNTTKINSLGSVFTRNNNSYFRRIMGREAFEGLFSTNDSINELLFPQITSNKPKSNEIKIERNGEVGFINESEFNPSTDKRI